MIKDIKLSGFKSFLDETIHLNQLTVLTGLNSSGKSTVIQALRMVNRMCMKKNCLLAGYGDWKELKNKNYDDEPMIEVFDDKERHFVCGEINKDAVNPLESGFPKLIYLSASRYGPQDIIPVFAGESDIDEFGNNVVKNIKTHQSDILPEALWLEEGQGVTHEYMLDAWVQKISPDVKFSSEMVEKADASYTTFNGYRAKNVGFGLSFTLPVITSLLEGVLTPDSLVIIENPEAHLHAKAQTEIADLIARCVEAGAQVIVETHSDHLFDGLRIYVKEHPGFEKKMNCYWFELDEDKNTEATLIELNSKGRIVNLTIPSHFMDQFEYNSQRLLFGR